MHAGKINYQKPFRYFFRTIVFFDLIAPRAFCISVDLNDQQEIVCAFSRAREKATQIHLKRTKMITLFFSSNLPKASVILQPISHDIHRRKCSAFYGEDNVFVKMYATLPNFLIGQIGGLLACVKFCLRRGTFSGLLSIYYCLSCSYIVQLWSERYEKSGFSPVSVTSSLYFPPFSPFRIPTPVPTLSIRA